MLSRGCERRRLPLANDFFCEQSRYAIAYSKVSLKVKKSPNFFTAFFILVLDKKLMECNQSESFFAPSSPSFDKGPEVSVSVDICHLCRDIEKMKRGRDLKAFSFRERDVLTGNSAFLVFCLLCGTSELSLVAQM